jgi:hypothetical protein
MRAVPLAMEWMGEIPRLFSGRICKTLFPLKRNVRFAKNFINIH